MDISVLLADDHKILRDGLKNVIESRANLSVVAEATDGREAVKLSHEHKPDVVVMDVAMPGLNGVEATKQIIKDNPDAKIIALSMHSNRRYISGMFKAGAYGYLMKDCESEELIKAIETVAHNQKYLSQKISGIILNEYMSTLEEEGPELSGREKEILQLIAEGKSSRDIGEILFLSSKTIDAHRKNIMDKLNMYTIPELTKYAIRSGLITLDE
ncbi:MAG: response regulator transcription factor [Bacteroidales bacterium]|nr:response regulator transcription factor [Bacteroidales bacterium]